MCINIQKEDCNMYTGEYQATEASGKFHPWE